MRITTDLPTALADQGNRAEALSQIMRSNEDADVEGTPVEDMAEWIDDVIIQWVDQYKQEIAEGLPSPENMTEIADRLCLPLPPRF